MDSKRKIAKTIFGEIAKPKPTDDFEVTPDVVAIPLAYPGSAIRCFCLGCGESVELLPEGAEALAERGGAVVPASWDDYYFTVRRCIVCDSKFKEPRLKKKSEV